MSLFSHKPSRWRPFRKLKRFRGAMYLVAPILLLVSVLIRWATHSSELSLASLQLVLESTLKNGIPLALLAMGAALVLATGGVDISTAGVATASGVLFAILTQLGLEYPVAALPALLLGVVSGLAVGWLVWRKKAPALILTWSAAALWIVLSKVFSAKLTSPSGESAPREFLGSVTGISVAPAPDATYWSLAGAGTVAGLLTLLFAHLLLTISQLPEMACAVGANRDSAAYIGLRAGRVGVGSYVWSGLLASSAGVFFALVSSSGRTNDLSGRELVAVATAVLGGTAMSGGYLRLGSVIAAAMLWSSLESFTLSSEGPSWLNDAIGQQRAATAIFALVLIAIVFPLGARLSGRTITIHAEAKARED